MRERKREREKKNTGMTMVCSQITGGLKRYIQYISHSSRERENRKEGRRQKEGVGKQS